MSSSGEPGNPREPQGELWIDRWILPALRDLALLPIVLVVIGHVIAFAVPALIFALRDGRIGAQMAVFALFALSFAGVRFEFRRHGRPGLLSGWIGGAWLAAIATSWVCNRYAIF
jgi:hypothetical protein